MLRDVGTAEVRKVEVMGKEVVVARMRKEYCSHQLELTSTALQIRPP